MALSLPQVRTPRRYGLFVPRLISNDAKGKPERNEQLAIKVLARNAFLEERLTTAPHDYNTILQSLTSSHVRRSHPDQLAKSAWALAVICTKTTSGSLRESVRQTCGALLDEAARRPPATLSGRHISTLLWASAHCELAQNAGTLLNSLGRLGSSIRVKLNSQEASNVFWALATRNKWPGGRMNDIQWLLQLADDSIAVALTELANGIPNVQLRAQHVASTAWALARLDRLHDDNRIWKGRFFDALVAAAPVLPKLFTTDARALASTVYACAKVLQTDRVLVISLVQEVTRQLRDSPETFDSQSVANLAWALARGGCGTPDIAIDAATSSKHARWGAEAFDSLRALSDMVALRIKSHGGDLPGATPQHIASIAWALAHAGEELAGPERPRALINLRCVFLSRIADFTDTQCVANLAWAFARLAWDEASGENGLPEGICTAAARVIFWPQPQHLANTAWALARLQMVAPPNSCIFANTFWRRCNAELSELICHPRNRGQAEHWKLQELIATTCSLAVASVLDESLAAAVGAEVESRLQQTSEAPTMSHTMAELRARAGLSWAFATATLQDRSLFSLLEERALRMLADSSIVRVSAKTVASSIECRKSLLGLSWAFAFVGERGPRGPVPQAIRSLLEDAGVLLDDVERGPTEVRLQPLHRSTVDVPSVKDEVSGTEPVILAEWYDGAYVIFKPPGWEVDVAEEESPGGNAIAVVRAPPQNAGASQMSVKHRRRHWHQRLSNFVISMLPRVPIANDRLFDHGILHRLDANSSGLVLGASNYEAYFRLHWALHTYQIGREYVVLCHGHVEPDLKEVHTRLIIRDRSSRPMRGEGLPAITHLKVVAHLQGPAKVLASSPERALTIGVNVLARNQRDLMASSAAQGTFSLVVIRIHTGRHHQIRAHLQYVGHPVVCDARYAPIYFDDDSSWCPNIFLHRFRLSDIPTNCGSFNQVAVGLPTDLLHALRLLIPSDESSAAAFNAWAWGDCNELFCNHSQSHITACDQTIPKGFSEWRVLEANALIGTEKVVQQLSTHPPSCNEEHGHEEHADEILGAQSHMAVT